MGDFDLLGFLGVNVPHNSRPSTAESVSSRGSRVIAPVAKPLSVSSRDGVRPSSAGGARPQSTGSQRSGGGGSAAGGPAVPVPSMYATTYRAAFMPGSGARPGRRGAETLLNARDRREASSNAQAQANEATDQARASAAYHGLKTSLQRGTIQTPGGFIANEALHEADRRARDAYFQNARADSPEHSSRAPSEANYSPPASHFEQDSPPPRSGAQPQPQAQAPAPPQQRALFPAEPRQAAPAPPPPAPAPQYDDRDDVSSMASSAANPNLPPKCDLCINDSLIEHKHARLRREREREMADARAAEEAAAREGAALKARAQAERQRQIDEANRNLAEIHATKMAQAYEQEAERAAELENLERLRRMDNSEAARQADLRRRQLQHDLADQIETKRRNQAAEAAEEAEAGFQGGLPIAPSYNQEIARRNQLEYRDSLARQIEETRNNRATDAAEQLAEDQARLAALAAQAPRGSDRAAQRAALEHDWKEAAEMKHQRAVNEALEDAQFAADRDERQRQDDANRAHHEIQVKELNRQFADVLKQQMNEKQRHAREEADYDAQFQYVPSAKIMQALIECRKCHRNLPESRFRGSPQKVKAWKHDHHMD